MSTIPRSVREANAVIRAGAALDGYRAVISTRAVRSSRGYHAGKAEIYGPDGAGDRDYSVRRRRDKAGLSNASAAQDISFRSDGSPGSAGRARRALVDLCAYLVDLAKTGGTRDLVEVIGPGADGDAYYQAAPRWRARPRPDGDSHEWHIHVAHFRDAEDHDLAAIFLPFWPELTQRP